MSEDRGYLLDNRRAEAGRRLDAISELFDPTTFSHALDLGLGPGWRVWEVGAGGPSVPRWLGETVGPSGRVVATDINTSWLDSLPRAIEVVSHDVAADPPVPGPFDLVHSRLVLVHLVGRLHALGSMVSVLRPGGWLLLEEADPLLQPLACPDEAGVPERLANKLRDGFRSLMAERGVDLAFGRTLPRLMRDAGLEDVSATAIFPIGGPACDALERATVEQIGQQLLDAGLADPVELEQHLANVDEGRLTLTTAPMISAVGRKPGP